MILQNSKNSSIHQIKAKIDFLNSSNRFYLHSWLFCACFQSAARNKLSTNPFLFFLVLLFFSCTCFCKSKRPGACKSFPLYPHQIRPRSWCRQPNVTSTKTLTRHQASKRTPTPPTMFRGPLVNFHQHQ